MKYVIALVFLLSGCGGGTENNTSASESNNAPSIYVYSVTNYFEGDDLSMSFDVSDLDGDSLSLSLSGDDAKLFSVNVSESLVTSVVVFDFEVPLDADQNNIYEFDLIVSDGTVNSSFSISLFLYLLITLLS